MLALSPPSFPNFGWPLEDPISLLQNQFFFRDQAVETSESAFFSLPSPPPPPLPAGTTPETGQREFSPVFDAAGGNPTLVKKLNHNASERDRRKKINGLYSSLRSLLPASDQKKKLSIPATVSRMLKYIPELQKEVERLGRKKEELLASTKSRQENLASLQHINQQAAVGRVSSSAASVSATPLGEREVTVQISTAKQTKQKGLLSEALQSLEEDGLALLDASSFQSLGDRVFYNLHLQIQGGKAMQVGVLREKLISLFEKKQGFFT